MPLIYEPRGKAAEYSPLAMNIYKGCAHGCVYCYAPAATYTQREIFHANVQPRNNFIQELQKDLIKFRGDKRPILLCFTTDPYQPIEETAKLTRWTLRSLIENRNVVKILTKGGMRAVRDFDLMKSGDVFFGATLTLLDDVESKKWEPVAALPADRINALRLAKEAGIKTWVSLEPVINPQTVYAIIRATYKFTDLYKIGKLNYHPLSKKINWHDFRVGVELLLTSLKKKFYIKQSLRKF